MIQSQEIILEWEPSMFHSWEGQATRWFLDKYFVHWYAMNGEGIVIRKNGLVFAMEFTDEAAEQSVIREISTPTMPSRNPDDHVKYLIYRRNNPLMKRTRR